MHGDEHKDHKKSPRGKKKHHHKQHAKKESHHINVVQPVLEADIAASPTTNINVMKLDTQAGADKARKGPAVEVQLATGDSLTVTNREKPSVGGGFDEASRKQL